MKKTETHLFIIWEKARYKEKEILSDISSKLRIVEVLEVRWSQQLFSNNLTRFYGQKLPNNSFKEKHCGTGSFLLIICEDENPKYSNRDTISREIELVNSNVFDFKQKFRDLTGGGHKIHSTNNEVETNHDLALLLGVNVTDYNVSKKVDWDGNVVFFDNDLIGANGWQSPEELFYTLNACEEYVVLRNFDTLPDQMTISGHDDVDFLVENYKNFEFLLNGVKVFKKRYRVHFEILVSNKKVLVDIRYIGDDYYDEKWQREILNTKERYNGFYIPSPENHKYSVLYHALMHKQEIAGDYLKKLDDWFGSKDLDFLKKEINDYLKKCEYQFVEPKDYSVFYTARKLTIQRRLFYKILNIKKLIKRILK